MPNQPTRFYFDFLSPYSYLASARLARRDPAGRAHLDYRPVPVGSLLARRGLIGPGEIEVKRSFVLDDCLLLAQRYGVPFEGPPRQPFPSVPALRSVLAVEDPEARQALTHRYFHAAWGEGRDLDDPEVLTACLGEVGIDQDPEAARRDRSVRDALKREVAEAHDLGVFGVPTFVTVDGVRFFGHDRLALCEDYGAGNLTLDRSRIARLMERPRGVRIV